jgi:hypothetical protein
MDGGERSALRQVVAVEEAFGGPGLTAAASDDDIRQYAERRAAWVMSRLYDAVRATAGALRDWLASVLARDGIEVPDVPMPGLVARVTSARWWRRKLRSTVIRAAEGALIRSGVVHVLAGCYCSDSAVARWEQQSRRNRSALDAAVATNEAGQEFRLEELASVSVANPAIRHAEMMTRIRGVEESANARAWSAFFVTLTCPSLFHARHHSGKPNDRYTDRTPKEGQAWLVGQWAKARAKLSRDGIGMMGIRVAEPHHDGTPHWHVLIFCRAADSEVIRAVLYRYAMEMAPDEPGAKARRMRWEAIDYRKGSAVGYVAKYIAKNINGESVDGDVDTSPNGALETGMTAQRGAQRVTAWARVWGIRQFQFFGVPGVGAWRELRRVKELGPEQLDFFDAWQATRPADQDGDADWSAYMDAVASRPIAMVKEARESIYPGECNQAVVGLECGGARLITREHVWDVVWGAKKGSGQGRGKYARAGSGAGSAPWTCVNNCTEGDCDGFEGAGGVGVEPGPKRIEGGRFSAAGFGAGADSRDVGAGRGYGGRD